MIRTVILRSYILNFVGLRMLFVCIKTFGRFRELVMLVKKKSICASKNVILWGSRRHLVVLSMSVKSLLLSYDFDRCKASFCGSKNAMFWL